MSLSSVILFFFFFFLGFSFHICWTDPVRMCWHERAMRNFDSVVIGPAGRNVPQMCSKNICPELPLPGSVPSSGHGKNSSFSISNEIMTVSRSVTRPPSLWFTEQL